MYRKEKMGTLLIIAIFVAFFVMTGNVNAKCQMYPYVISSIGFILSSLNLGIVLYKEKAGIPINVSASMTPAQMMSIAITLVASFAYIYLAQYVGYFVMTFIFITGFSYWHSKNQKIWMYPTVAGVMCAVIYVAFKVFLKVPLPSGFLF